MNSVNSFIKFIRLALVVFLPLAIGLKCAIWGGEIAALVWPNNPDRPGLTMLANLWIAAPFGVAGFYFSKRILIKIGLDNGKS